MHLLCLMGAVLVILVSSETRESNDAIGKQMRITLSNFHDGTSVIITNG